jgi:hypothetical protein
MSVPDALKGQILLVAITSAFAYATLWLFAVVRFDVCADDADDADALALSLSRSTHNDVERPRPPPNKHKNKYAALCRAG